MNHQWPLVVNDVSDVLGSLHVILASVCIDADVTDLLVCAVKIVFDSILIVVLIVVVHIRIWILVELLSKLEDNLVLLSDIFVVWIDKHVLVVISHVEVLVNLLLVLGDCQDHAFLLDGELRVLVLQEWTVDGVMLLLFVSKCIHEKLFVLLLHVSLVQSIEGLKVLLIVILRIVHEVVA